LAGNSYEVCDIISVFNFSCPFVITSLICCEVTKAEMTIFSSPVACQHAEY